MKALILVAAFAVVASAQSAHAGSQVFKAEASANKKSNFGEGLNPFNELEQAGMERMAERKAMADCAEAGAMNCVITGASLITCNVFNEEESNLYSTYTLCRARATVRGEL